MKYTYSSSGVLLAHQILEIGTSLYWSLAVISLFVFGLLLCRKFVKTPKGLVTSSLVSYGLLLVNIFDFLSDLPIPKAIGYFCFAVGIYPNILIVYLIEVFTDWLFGEEWLFESGWWVIFDGRVTIYLAAFTINTLVIFAIIRLILYIKHKLSAKKSQGKQAV
ncbi:MAG TPA: hypothetical protein VMW23_01385 [Sedimentisphaerales bacterium]|nr:hypothetical protein [Sedimentisphaerales bacterium]